MTYFSNPPMLDLPERPEYSHWGDGLKKDHRVSTRFSSTGSLMI